VLFDLIAFYCAGDLDGSAKKENFSVSVVLPASGVRDDGKCPSFLNFTIVLHAGAKVNF
jgi:sRNA-binding regulator protein Hfq